MNRNARFRYSRGGDDGSLGTVRRVSFKEEQEEEEEKEEGVYLPASRTVEASHVWRSIFNGMDFKSLHEM